MFTGNTRPNANSLPSSEHPKSQRDPRIVSHERARAVASRLYDYQIKLESQGLEGDELQKKLENERTRLSKVIFTEDRRIDRFSGHHESNNELNY